MDLTKDVTYWETSSIISLPTAIYHHDCCSVIFSIKFYIYSWQKKSGWILDYALISIPGSFDSSSSLNIYL